MALTGRVRIRTGNQMIAEGAIAAGCRFFAGYPITPASGIFKAMIDRLQAQGDLALSAPDEISALAYCVGASMRGYKAMTATSGPGWALMIETVQYALMTETPVVIAVVQRLGPSTGSATQGGQGDILLTEFCTGGAYTVPVFCPSTAAECFDLTVTAFNWAEELRTPVILLADKEVSMTSECVPGASDHPPSVVNRRASTSATTGTYAFEHGWEVPAFAPVGESLKVTATGSAHNKAGGLRKNDTETLEVLRHLEDKIRHRADDMELVDEAGDPEAPTLVVSFGVTARAARQAQQNLSAQGRRVTTLTVRSLFPMPEHAIRKAAAGKRRVVVAEENLTGQYRMLLAPLVGGAELVGVNGIGRMITPQEIERVVL